MTDALEVAARFFHAIETGDLDAVSALYADDAVIWHNYDGVAQSKAQNLKVLAWMAGAIPERSYKVVRREAIADGFLQQHVLELRRANAHFEMPACIVARLRGRQIVRLDEYLDSAHVTQMGARLSL
jgi:ketosteroid isomerase-like protein